jgi:hypothetical protein
VQGLFSHPPACAIDAVIDWVINVACMPVVTKEKISIGHMRDYNAAQINGKNLAFNWWK